MSETETASSATSWAGIIVAFKPGCTSGGLSLTSPASVTFPSVTLNGNDQTNTVTGVLTPNDQTNSNAGWNIAGTSTTFKNGTSKTLLAGAVAPAAAKLYNAAADSGAGPSNVTLTVKLAVAANTFNGTYTWTFTIPSAP